MRWSNPLSAKRSRSSPVNVTRTTLGHIGCTAATCTANMRKGSAGASTETVTSPRVEEGEASLTTVFVTVRSSGSATAGR